MVTIKKLEDGTYLVNGKKVGRCLTILTEHERNVYLRYRKGENLKLAIESSVMPVDQPTFNEMITLHQNGLK